MGRAGAERELRPAADAEGVGGAGAAVGATGRGLGAVGAVSAAAEAAEDVEDLVGCGVVVDGRVDRPRVGGGRRGRGGRLGGQESGGSRGVGSERGRQGCGGADSGGDGDEEQIGVGGEIVRVGVGGAGEEGKGGPFAAYSVQVLVDEHGSGVVAGWKLGFEEGLAGNHAIEAGDGSVDGLGGLSAVSGGLPVLTDTEGVHGGVYAGVDDIPGRPRLS